ncbi:MAG TPA: 3-oxoacyl-[acyl-carrier-protein] reductase [Candidatus Cloacimonetes bacterium]|nr:3-oxoacyl-[acyl-carrier-protein] reductase [Candidatus Cloacimonadota bacterium]HHE40055.1 3-oxoacyl-[acyl-carrier-protein] reductase [Candidatus Cloacimonadota bacterium]
MNRFDGKVAVITGSARGIGKSIARLFAEQGAQVVIADILQDDIDKTVDEFTSEGLKAAGFQCNITSEEEVENFMKDIYKKFSSIDILINNAGITADTLLIRMKKIDWDKVINVNLTGTFICTQKAAKYMMKQRHGKIVNVSSVIGFIGNFGQANYAASKGGIIAFTKSVSKELASRNINVNAVAPGFIRTAMTDALPEEIQQKYLENISLKRFGTPEDVGKLVLFLSSEDADYITGQTIIIDGGMI